MREVIDEKTLPGHFMTFRYIKAMKPALFRLIELDLTNPYMPH